MTVLQLISSSGYYGMENMLVTLSRGLSCIGVRTIIGVFEDARDPHTEIAGAAERLGLKVEKIPCCGRLDLRALTIIRKLTSTCSVDVIHSHGYKADIYARLSAGRRQALVATSHNWPSRRFNMRFYAALDRFALRGFDRVAVVSDVVGRKLEQSGINKDAIVSIPNGVDLERFHHSEPTLREKTIGDEGVIVGCVGRAIPAKGGREFLEAAQQVLAKFPGTRFVWIGDGPSLPVWKQFAEHLGMSANVRFTGSRNDMPGIYASLDIVVLPSLEEAMPMCLLEAMAAARPVVASDVGAVNQVVRDGITGLLVPPGDTAALAASIMRLVDDRALAEAFGTAAVSRATALFSIEGTAQRYAAIYESACSRRLRLDGIAALERSTS